MKQVIYVSSERFRSTNVTSDNIFRNLVVVLYLVDRFALPEFLHLVRKPLLFTPVVLVENLLLALLVLNVSLSLSSRS